MIESLVEHERRLGPEEFGRRLNRLGISFDAWFALVEPADRIGQWFSFVYGQPRSYWE